ncbi:MAG: helix-turn-helix transcriptional regulator [Myxococcales bacterium]|nr:helix-turn-helix transcriptional regulator [Myxococcales bacterium]
MFVKEKIVSEIKPGEGVGANSILSLADRMKGIRRWTKMTQQEFADALGVSQGYVSDIELHKAKPNLAMVLSVPRAFPEVRIEWLMTGLGSMLVGGEGPEGRADLPIPVEATKIALEITNSYVHETDFGGVEDLAGEMLYLVQNMCARAARYFMRKGFNEESAFQVARYCCEVFLEQIPKGSPWNEGREEK